MLPWSHQTSFIDTMPPERKRRGPYKQYLRDPDAQVPKTTLWDRRQREEQNQHNPNAQQQLPLMLGINPNGIHVQGMAAAAENNHGVIEEGDNDLSHVSDEHSDDATMQNGEEVTYDPGEQINLGTLNENSDRSSQEIPQGGVPIVSSSSGSSSEDSTDNDSSEEDELNNGQETANEYEDVEDDDFPNQYVEGQQNLEGVNFFNQQQFDVNANEERRLLYAGSQISAQESDLLIMSFIIRWGLEEKCIEDLLRLIDCHLPASLLGSKYLFLKKFPTGPAMHVRYFCRDCSYLLPAAEGKNISCSCGFAAEVNDLKNDKKYFIQLDVAEQVRQVMENRELAEQMRKDCWESDVVSGKLYRRLRARGLIGDDDLTLQWNTDGVKPFKSSRVCFYPVQACINELPMQARKDNMLLCGLYYGKGKPDMNVILKPFVDELRILHEEGISCNILDREQVTVKVHTLICSVDSVARPPLQGIHQFNGRYGCSFCLRKGKRIVRGKASSRVYIGGAPGIRRTTEQHLRALECLEQYNLTHRKAKTHIQGVKTGSVLLLLPIFDIIRSFVPDYLHGTLEGAVVTFWKHWTDSQYDGMPWYLSKRKRVTINNRLEKIRPPVEVTRPPRSLDEIALWKASEIKSFLIYYSLPCLKGILPGRYFKHWFLLVYSITVFLKEKIEREEFLRARHAIVTFVEDIMDLYPACLSLYTFNVHLLLHVPKAVEDFGALWASSNFPYEHFNGVLTRLITGTQGVPTQVCRSYLRLRHVGRTSAVVFGRNDCSEVASKFYKDMLSRFHSKCSQSHGADLRVFGKPENYDLSLIEKTAVEELLRCNVMRSTQSFRRMIIKKKVFHASVYGALLARDNSVAQTNAGLFVYINRILFVRIPNCEQVVAVAVCNEIQPFNEELCVVGNIGASSRQIIQFCNKSNRIVSILPSSIVHKCVLVPHEDNVYVMPLVNSLERD